MTTILTPEQQEWVDALRYGDFKQGKGQLHNDNDEDFLWQANIHAFLAQRDHMRQIQPQADMQFRNPVDEPIINTPPPTEAIP